VSSASVKTGSGESEMVTDRLAGRLTVVASAAVLLAVVTSGSLPATEAVAL
jgi:hypothetical protein